jgi:hypothetical protein
MDELSVARAAELAGMTPGQVSRQIFLGLVRPEVHAPNGIGDASVLGYRNVRELKLINRLRQAGLKQETIKSVIDLLANSSLDWWKGKEGECYVVALKDRWMVTDNPFSQANRKLFKEEGIIILVEL